MNCKRCNQKIPGYDKRQIYCSRACYSESCKKIREPKICKECGISFELSRFNCRNIFCSETCFHKNNTRDKVRKICPECSAFFYVGPYQANRIHCSKICMYKKVTRFNSEIREKPTREKNGRFKDGITFYRELAFEHFPHRCNRCLKRGCKFEVHHIDENRHNNCLQNLEILCLSCHKKHHKSKPSAHP